MSAQRAALPPRWALVSWTLLIGALLALLIFAADYGKGKQERELRQLLFANTPWPEHQLRDCLGRGLPLTGHWEEVAPNHMQGWNNARHTRADVFDMGAYRRVELATPGGRPLRDQEKEALRRCLAGQ